jgi:septal ring factor EnvC (AmiA/AmiB activator)
VAHGCIVALLPVAFCAAQQADRTRTEALAKRAADRMQALQREADQLAEQERTLLGDLRKLEIQRQIAIERTQQVEAEAAEVRGELADTTAQLTALERQDAETIPELRARLVAMYKLGQARYVRLLLSTTDLRRLGEASRTVAVLAELDRERVAAHQRTAAQLRAARAALETRGRRLTALAADAQRAQAAVERAAAARDEAIRRIDGERDLNAQLTGELQSARQKLQSTVAALAAGDAGAAPATLPLQPFRGALEWPVTGTIRRAFTRPIPGRPITNGIDIAAAEGAPVVAVHPGTVAFAGAFTGFGQLVILDHGSQSFSLYGDLAEVRVKKGDRVVPGEKLGTVGLQPAGPSGLYFELRIDGQPVDPLQWLQRK